MSLFTILEVLAIIGSGLTAGVFYAFSTFVMAALARIPPDQGIAAMNSINITVINPWFFSVFLGTPVVCAILFVMAVLKWSEPGAAVIIAASVLYIVGTLIVTMVFNVPLNNELATITSANGAGGTLWNRYLSDWTFWNSVRTAAPLLAMVLFIWGLIQRSAA